MKVSDVAKYITNNKIRIFETNNLNSTTFPMIFECNNPNNIPDDVRDMDLLKIQSYNNVIHLIATK